MLRTFPCAHCGNDGLQESGAVNRARKGGYKLYCSKSCSRLGRRKNKSDEQKRKEKSEYDALRRLALRDVLRAKKAAYYQRTKNPEKERVARKKRAPMHAEYCRQPEYRKWKRDYDIQRRGMDYGEYAECHRLLIDLEREIRATMPRYEIYKLNGYYERQNERRRQRRRENV